MNKELEQTIMKIGMLKQFNGIELIKTRGYIYYWLDSNFSLSYLIEEDQFYLCSEFSKYENKSEEIFENKMMIDLELSIMLFNKAVIADEEELLWIEY